MIEINRTPEIAPNECVHLGFVAVDSGHVELGDCGDVQIRVETDQGDGYHPFFIERSEDGHRWLVVDLDPLFEDN